MNLYFLKHNNYYNRQYKPIDSLANANIVGQILECNNFTPNDGVDTQQVSAYGNFTDVPDYMVAMEGNKIVSRWFVVEMKRLRGMQYKLDLHRDVIADYYEAITKAPVFIEKGYLAYNNPLIFNKEQMSFNKIKKQEILLQDETKCPWLVAYVANIKADEFPTDGIKGTASNTNPEYDESLTSLIDWTYYDYCNFTINRQDFYVGAYNTTYDVYGIQKGKSYPTKVTYSDSGPIDSIGKLTTSDTTCRIDDILKLRPLFITTYKDQLNSKRLGQINAKDNAAGASFLAQDGKILRVGESTPYRYYHVSVKGISKTIESYLSAGSMYNVAKAWIEASGGTNVDDKCFYFKTDTTSYVANLEDITTAVSATFTHTKNKQELTDAPYTMLVAPYIDATMHFSKDGTIEQFPLTKSIQMEAMSNFVYNAQSYMYDFQLLPYCPIAGITTITDEQGTDMYISNPAEKTYAFIDDSNGSHYGIVFYAQYSKFSKSIPMSSNSRYDSITKVINDSVERKIKNETELVRFCSPNGSNSWDFQPQMNDGFDYIQVDCTYKPYSPYIHVAPDFAGLYGDNFGDTRGLIVQGDFSLPVITDQWKEYEIQNKNYANVFQRENESLAVQEKYRKIEQGFTIATGTIAAGVQTASQIGGMAGAIAGGVTGALSLGAGIADYNISRRLYEENMDYRQDMYNYNLENIKARPNGLAKTSAFTNNNKIYPFIEVYSATDTEKEALRNKIKYNGMTVGVIGNILDFVGSEETYVKGNLIKIDITDDYHMCQAINNELSMGIRIGG